MLKLFKVLLDPRPQLFFFAVLAVVLQVAIWLISPAQGPVVLYKLGLPVLAAIVGLFFDFAVFPFARPDSYLDDYWKKDPDADRPNDADYPIATGYEGVFCNACLRRAIIIGAFVLAVSLGL
ncbi:MAG: hypothetical protein DELT_02539 [Desulfovibrio sp.]